MTPAISVVEKNKITHKIHEYTHDPASQSYGLEAAEKLGLPPARVFKTLVVELDGRELAVAVIPVSAQLSMKLMAKALGAKKAAMAAPAAVQRATGYVLGGVSPLGQKKRLRTVIDTAADSQPTIFVSAGRRGLEIELNPADLLKLVNGEFRQISQ